MSEGASSIDEPSRLRRVVGLPGAIFLGLGSILGTGVFLSLGIAAGVAGSGVALAVILAALLAAANGLSSAQLAAAHPVSGGTYEYGHQFVHPLAGFIAGWTFLAAKSASGASAALGCAGYLLHALGLATDASTRIGIALAIVVVFTALVAGGVERSSRANIGIVGLTLLALLAFIVFGWMSADLSDAVERIDPLSSFGAPGNGSEGGVDLRALLQATALLFVAYTGYGRIATLGEEAIDPARTIPRAIILTLALTMLLYLAVTITALAVSGAGAFAEAAREMGAPLETVARSFTHPEVATLVAAGAVTAMAGVLLNLLLGLSRVLLAMARRGEMPRAMADVNEATGSPSRAVWVMGALIAALVLLGDIETTWSLSAFTVLVYYGITNIAALRLPKSARRYPRWIALAGLVSCAGLAFFVEQRISVAGVVLVGAGAVGFILGGGWRRRS